MSCLALWKGAEYKCTTWKPCVRGGGVGTECSMLNGELSGQAANDVSGRFIRSAGRSSLSRSSNQTDQKDQIDETNQIPATHREMVRHRFISLVFNIIVQIPHGTSRFVRSFGVCFPVVQQQMNNRWPIRTGEEGAPISASDETERSDS
jgi:hypothetical protein